MPTSQESYENALNNIAHGTAKAAKVKTGTLSNEFQELANAVHYIGFGLQEFVQTHIEESKKAARKPR